MNGEMRCRPGDLAIIVRQEAGCDENLGRVVEVDAPIRVNPELGLACRRIRPIGGALSTVTGEGVRRFECADLRSSFEHPDAWLLPVQRDDAFTLEEMQEYRRMQDEFDRALVEMGVVAKPLEGASQ